MGFLIPETIRRRIDRTRIVKAGTERLRVYVGKKWIEQLDEDGREKLAIGLDSDPPGYVIIARAKDFTGRGYKTRYNADGSVCFTATVCPELVEHLFPNDECRIFIPKSVQIVRDPSGVKGIALEWSGCSEHMLSQEGRNDVEQNQMSEDVSSRLMENENPSSTEDALVPIKVDQETSAANSTEKAVEFYERTGVDFCDKSSDLIVNNSTEGNVEEPDDSEEHAPALGIDEDLVEQGNAEVV